MKRCERSPGSLRDLEARLQTACPHIQLPGEVEGEHRVGGHSRSTLQRIFHELPPDRMEEARELMMLPGYAQLRPDDPRAALDFYLRLPRYARAAIQRALRGRSIQPRLLNSYRQRLG